MAAALRVTKLNVVQATAKHTATLIFFHGSGDSGDNIKEYLRILNKNEELKFPHIKIIYPSAPLQPYTPIGGELSNVWFDRSDISKSVLEEKASIDAVCEELSWIFDKEVAAGIPYDRIAVAGFSMGGALSFHLAYRFKRSLAGCCTMSAFLNDNSVVYEALKKAGTENAPPLLQFHGDADSLVPIAWGEETFKILNELGIKGEFVRLKNIDHELTSPVIKRLKAWLLNVLPEKF